MFYKIFIAIIFTKEKQKHLLTFLFSCFKKMCELIIIFVPLFYAAVNDLSSLNYKSKQALFEI